MPAASPAKSSTYTVGAMLLLLLLAGQLIHLSRATSMTWDEGHHLYDGDNIWKNFDYRLNPEVPPLVKLVAALPLLHARLYVPPNQEREEETEAYLDARAFHLVNGYDRVLVPARLACMCFVLALAFLLYAATREIFSPLAALFALGFFVFDPNILAHGALVTIDVPNACLMLASIYSWYRYCKRPSPVRLLLVELALGLAVVAKFTGIFFWPMLFLLAAVEAIQHRDLRLFGRRFAALGAVALLAYGILWAFYGFHYSVRHAGLDMHPPLAEYLAKLPNPADAKHLAFLARFHLLPEAYIWGLADTKLTAFYDLSYFFGHVYRHGNWMYFPAAFLIKSTLPLLLLLCLVPFAWRRGWWPDRLFELACFTLPVAIYFAIAMSSDMNIGLRHILPIYPFLYILVAGAASALFQANRRWATPLALLLIWQIATSAYAAPGYMGYANEAWGGSDRVNKYLSDSNSDWGQQLKSMKTYMDQHHITNCWFAYFADGVIEPSDYGIHCKRLTTIESTQWLNLPMDVPPEIDGTVFLSGSDIAGVEYGQGALNPYDSFRNIKPTAIIEHGLFVFDPPPGRRFSIPLASALDQAEKAETALFAKHLYIALPHAQQAVRLAPQSVRTQTVLGDILTAQGRTAEARAHYAAALQSARTIDPPSRPTLFPALKPSSPAFMVQLRHLTSASRASLCL